MLGTEYAFASRQRAWIAVESASGVSNLSL
jgi:hypothetical protein